MPIKIEPVTTIPIEGYVSQELLEGRRGNIFTHNFSKKESWYQDSTRVTGETLTDSGDHTTYNPATSRYWVDATHGKLFNERDIQDTYKPVVKVDGTTKTENPPGTTSGDYSVNYATGAVTFNQALAGTEVVTADYSYVGTSVFKIQAPSGYKLLVGYVEICFSEDITIEDTIIFQLWGNIGSGMQPLSGAEYYQTWADFVMDANGYIRDIPGRTGGTAWRNQTQSKHKLIFDYRDIAVITLESAYSMEIRVWCENHIPQGGDLAMATFYIRKVEV